METSKSKIQRRALIALTILGLGTYYAYTRLSHASAVSDAVDMLPAYSSEKLVLDSVEESAKNYTLKLKLHGVNMDSEQLNQLKSHYQQVAQQFACNEPEFTTWFEQGYNINFEISYQQQPDTVFQQTYVSKSNCSSNKKVD